MSFLGVDIGSILRSEGPIVKCVLLSSFQRPNTENENENLKCPSNIKNEKDDCQKPQASSLHHLIYETDVDTTPSKAMVQNILGGPITFLGQYEEEGIVVIARRPETYSSEDEGNQNLPLNPHSLQPPLHKLKIYGDILLMRVSPIVDDSNENDDSDDSNEDEEEENCKEDKEDDDDEEEEEKEAEGVESMEKAVYQIDNESYESEEVDQGTEDEPEFFLDYTKDEYIHFASRTDIVYESNDEEEEHSMNDEKEGLNAHQGLSHEGDDETDEEYQVDEGDDDDSESDGDDCIGETEDQVKLMNLIFSQILCEFREEHGRGPNSEELLAMRSQLIEKLGIDIEASGSGDEEPDETNTTVVTTNLKRELVDEDASSNEQRIRAKKRVNFRDE